MRLPRVSKGYRVVMRDFRRDEAQALAALKACKAPNRTDERRELWAAFLIARSRRVAWSNLGRKVGRHVER